MHSLLVAAAALINAQGEVLLAQRPPHKSLPGRWEFPGGKVEAHETPEQALIRELGEELGVEVHAADCQPFWFLSHGYPEFGFHLIMPVWTIRRWQGSPRALEHAAICWKHPREMHTLSMIEADEALVAKLAQHLA